MQHEKAGEPFHWTNKLDELSALPGEPPAGKAAAWQKLHDRLQKKPHQERAAAYWAAAACMLLAAGIWWLTSEQRGGLVKNKEQQVQKDVVEMRIQVPGRKDTVTGSLQVIKEKNNKLPVELNHNIHSSILTNNHLPEHGSQQADSTQEPLPQIMVNDSQPVDTLTIAAIPVQKKLRVVHINELGHAEQETQLARNTPAPSIQPRLNPDDLSNFSVSRNASDNILKIKLSSN